MPIRDINGDLQTFASKEVLGRCEKEARIIVSVIARLERLLGENVKPLFWSVDSEWRCDDELFDDYWFYDDSQSKKELEEWTLRGGRLELLRPGGGSGLVVVRLISYLPGRSCFGASFPTSAGRRFALINNQTVRDTKALKKFLRARGAEREDLGVGLEFQCRDAPCQIALWINPHRT